jgi:hypothetical protein
MSLNRYLVSLVRRASVLAMLVFAVAAPVCAAGPYGDCYVLFVEGKAPQAPNAVTPLCEKRDDAVYFATGCSKRDNHGYWSAYRLDEEQIDEIDQLGLPRPNLQFKQNSKLKVAAMFSRATIAIPERAGIADISRPTAQWHGTQKHSGPHSLSPTSLRRTPP